MPLPPRDERKPNQNQIAIEIGAADDGCLLLEAETGFPTVSFIDGRPVEARIYSLHLGTFDPDIVAMIRDVADAQLDLVGRQSWREAFEDIQRLGDTEDAAKDIAAHALGPQPEGDPVETRVSLTRAGADCEEARAAHRESLAMIRHRVTAEGLFLQRAARDSLTALIDEQLARLNVAAPAAAKDTDPLSVNCPVCGVMPGEECDTALILIRSVGRFHALRMQGRA